ncbi:hypothetical protein AB0H83_19925 [Dactylosporangium sp. NPDC050688]|uniref:hypothetical protein n=1 Tax=Dactylosporangium sp. NPDC050688 TaxID=3157217 RepID=UPI0033F0429B
MGKSEKNSNFDSRGMHRSEDDLGYMDPDLADDMTITPDADIAGKPATANTATMQAKKLQQEQTTMQDKRGNQPDR